MMCVQYNLDSSRLGKSYFIISLKKIPENFPNIFDVSKYLKIIMLIIFYDNSNFYC